jgi:hypothetical protein
MTNIKQVAEGLNVISNYEDADIGVDHDIILVGPSIELTKEDTEKLIALGWFFSSEFSCWAIFV